MLVGPVGSDSFNPYFSASALGPVEEPLQAPVPSLAEPATETIELPVVEPAVIEGNEEQVEQENLPGVLRLLIDGHFRGVADIRLRIVFHDELEALQTEAARAASAEAAGALIEAVGVRLDELASSGALSEEQAIAVGELQQAFEQAVDEAVEQSNTAPGVDEEALTNGLQSAFDGLTDPLETLLAPSAPTEPADLPSEPVVAEPADLPSEPVVAEPAVGPSVLDALKDAFDAGMVQVNEALVASSILSPPSLPRGNGVAYEKFLSIYEELTGPAEPTDDTQDQAEEIVGIMDAVA